jgi:rhodanese-related sulfurtransferase
MAAPIRISVDEARDMMEEGEVTFLDVIDSHSYDNFDHQIEGAVRIKPEKIGDQFQQLPKEQTILAY